LTTEQPTRSLDAAKRNRGITVGSQTSHSAARIFGLRDGQGPENCLDIFVWSDAGFSNFISSIANKNTDANSVTRQTRTAIWLYKMLSDIKDDKKFNHQKIIDSLSYNTKNDKAFAVAGNVTNKYMFCQRLVKPIIKKSEIKKIVLGGGQNLLSPERRFDAILFNSPGLFA